MYLLYFKIFCSLIIWKNYSRYSEMFKQIDTSLNHNKTYFFRMKNDLRFLWNNCGMFAQIYLMNFLYTEKFRALWLLLHHNWYPKSKDILIVLQIFEFLTVWNHIDFPPQKITSSLKEKFITFTLLLYTKYSIVIYMHRYVMKSSTV